MLKVAALSQRTLFRWHTSECFPEIHPGVDCFQQTWSLLQNEICFKDHNKLSTSKIVIGTVQ